MDKINAGIVGASGYTGLELLKIIVKHQHIKVNYISSSTYEGKTLASINPYFKNKIEIHFEQFNEKTIKEKCGVLFFATPSGVAMKYAHLFYDSNIKIIDLSGDFRLASNQDYKEWYNREHNNPKDLCKWTYALSEIFDEEIKKAMLISNPGCYPTSILLALLPLLKIYIPKTTIICDSKSGVSGKGKKLSPDSLFFECNENLYAYKITNHQHIPEIEQAIHKYTKKNIKISFTPHLIPMDRGILSTIYINMEGSKLKEEDIKNHYKTFYKKKPFIKIIEDEAIPQTKNVTLTNECHISFKLDRRTNTLKIISVIDNLIKGAVGSAIQNLNLLYSIKEDEGLV